jgi:hypothetical protein
VEALRTVVPGLAYGELAMTVVLVSVPCTLKLVPLLSKSTGDTSSPGIPR